MREGSRHLRGKIAELIFEYLKPRLLGENLCCCSTVELSYSPWNLFSIDADSLLHDYVTDLNAAREVLGVERLEGPLSAFLSDDVKRDLVNRCLLCLKKGEVFIRVWVNGHRDGFYRSFYLCRDCLHRGTERGLVSLGSTTSLSHNLIACELSSTNKAFGELITKLVKEAYAIARLASLSPAGSSNPKVAEVLSRLNTQARAFLREVYGVGDGRYGQYPFDYVCVDDQGNAYLIDVTSVRGLDSSPAQLSEREKRVAEKAKKAGFKVLVPVVRFLSDWRVLIELVEA